MAPFLKVDGNRQKNSDLGNKCELGFKTCSVNPACQASKCLLSAVLLLPLGQFPTR